MFTPDRDCIVTALSAAPESEAAPVDIQWMPPGVHKIRATKAGKPAEMAVTVDKDAADLVAAAFDELTKKGTRPYLDFNHARGAAAGRVLAIKWGGDDPKTGGIRATVEWSKKGAEAIKGGAFDRFSPTFTVDKAGRISGTTANMGGLVNEPAFESISQVTAQEANTNITMKNTASALVAAGIVKAADESDEVMASAVASFADSARTVTARASALETENGKLTARVKELEETVNAGKKARAVELVDAAVADGRILSKDQAVRDFWVNNLVTAGAPAEAALAGIATNPALKSPERKSVDAARAEMKDLAGKQDAALIEARKALGATASYDAVFEAAARANPEIFKA